MANYRVDSPNISKDYQRQQQTIRERQQQPNGGLAGNYRINEHGAPNQTSSTMYDVDEDYLEQNRLDESFTKSNSNVYQFNDFRSKGFTQNESYDKILARQRGRSLGKYDQLEHQKNSTSSLGGPRSKSIPANHRVDSRHPLQKCHQQLQQVVNPIRQSPSIQRLPRGRIKLFSVFAIIYMLMLICGWQLLPFNKVNQVVVSGNYFVSDKAIAESSRIRPLDTVDEVFKHRQGIEQIIIQENPIVDSIVLSRDGWDHLLIQVNEHQIVAKVSQGNDWLPILTNGEHLGDPTTLAGLEENALTKLPILIDFNQKSKLIEMATILRQVDPAVLSQMDSIQLSSDSRKPNGIEVQMKDGNLIKAIISTFSQKVNYYPEILQQLDGLTGTVNFEVGAYFTPTVSNANSVNLDTN